MQGLFVRALAPPKTAPAPASLVERLLWWSWSRFVKRLAKRLHADFYEWIEHVKCPICPLLFDMFVH